EVEAARPLVYINELLLVLIVVGLNLAEIGIRHLMREKYRSLSHRKKDELMGLMTQKEMAQLPEDHQLRDEQTMLNVEN
ncbi:hypothetical protein H4F33_21760, partial [Pectobacterium brasiliense]|uniref:hypothetical protein n=1 Tax=Pectobacterium brasiliense TaxID=180957 RepID=UPI001F07441C